jgi:hypothetical protein
MPAMPNSQQIATARSLLDRERKMTAIARRTASGSKPMHKRQPALAPRAERGD